MELVMCTTNKMYWRACPLPLFEPLMKECENGAQLSRSFNVVEQYYDQDYKYVGNVGEN